jgi:hypothetical protein
MYILFVFSIILAMTGGWLDITKNNDWIISKEHAWNASAYLLLLTLIIKNIF